MHLEHSRSPHRQGPRRWVLGTFAILFSAALVVGCSSTSSTRTDATEVDAAASETEPVDDTRMSDDAGVGDDTSASMPMTDNPDLFVEANLIFVLQHELGHALVSEFGLPVVGREEDAVDRLATLVMTPNDDEATPDYLTEAINGWFSFSSETALEDIEWWGEHGTDQQRGYQIACLLYGSNPTQFAGVAESVDLPDDRRESCVDEAEQNQAAWSALLEPFFRADGRPADADTVTLAFDDTADYADEKSYLEDSRILDDLVEQIRVDYQFEPGITVLATECDVANAFWSARDRTVTLCYELVRDYQRLASS